MNGGGQIDYSPLSSITIEPLTASLGVSNWTSQMLLKRSLYAPASCNGLLKQAAFFSLFFWWWRLQYCKQYQDRVWGFLLLRLPERMSENSQLPDLHGGPHSEPKVLRSEGGFSCLPYYSTGPLQFRKKTLWRFDSFKSQVVHFYQVWAIFWAIPFWLRLPRTHSSRSHTL